MSDQPEPAAVVPGLSPEMVAFLREIMQSQGLPEDQTEKILTAASADRAADRDFRERALQRSLSMQRGEAELPDIARELGVTWGQRKVGPASRSAGFERNVEKKRKDLARKAAARGITARQPHETLEDFAERIAYESTPQGMTPADRTKQHMRNLARDEKVWSIGSTHKPQPGVQERQLLVGQWGRERGKPAGGQPFLRRYEHTELPQMPEMPQPEAAPDPVAELQERYGLTPAEAREFLASERRSSGALPGVSYGVGVGG